MFDDSTHTLNNGSEGASQVNTHGFEDVWKNCCDLTTTKCVYCWIGSLCCTIGSEDNKFTYRKQSY